MSLYEEYNQMTGREVRLIDSGNVGRALVHRVRRKGTLVKVDIETTTELTGSRMFKEVPKGTCTTMIVDETASAYAGWRLEEL